MDEDEYKVKIEPEEKQIVHLYELFSNPVKDLFIFIALFLFIYFVVKLFTVEVNIIEHQYIVDAQNKNVKPLVVDISSLNNHRFKKVEWHGLSIGIYKRTPIDFKNIAKRHPKKKPSEKSELKKKLDTYLLKNGGVLSYKELRSIKKQYFVFIMLRPSKGCELKVHFFHDSNDINKGQYANIVGNCSMQSYDMNGVLSVESYFTNGGLLAKEIFTNNLFIPNHRYIDENTIEFFPNQLE